MSEWILTPEQAVALTEMLIPWVQTKARGRTWLEMPLMMVAYRRIGLTLRWDR